MLCTYGCFLVVVVAGLVELVDVFVVVMVVTFTVLLVEVAVPG